MKKPNTKAFAAALKQSSMEGMKSGKAMPHSKSKKMALGAKKGKKKA